MSEEVPAISHSAPRPRAGSLTSGIVIIVTLAALAGYAFYEHRVCQQLYGQNQALAASLVGTRARIDELNAKLNSQETSRKPAASHPAQKLEGQGREQGKQIESTRQDLSSTRTALRGSIARTHGELVLLEKKGERAYFELDRKSTRLNSSHVEISY